MGLRTEFNTNPIVVDDFSTPLSPINRSCVQKAAEEPQNSMMFYNESNKYLQNVPSKHQIIYIALRSMWKLL